MQEQAIQRLQMPLAKFGNGAKIRRIERDDHDEIIALTARFRDPPRRRHAAHVGVQQQRDHQARIERRLPKRAWIGLVERGQIKTVAHEPDDEARNMLLGHEVLHIRRQQQRLIDLPGAIVLAHGLSMNQTRVR